MPFKIIELIEKLISKKNVSLLLFTIAIIYSIYALTITSAASLFENADLFKIGMFVSGISPYSTQPWQAPYPPFYFILWYMPYLLINAIFTGGGAQLYLGFKIFSQIVIYLTTFILYLTISAESKDKYRSISLVAIFLICAQTSIAVLTGDSLGLLLLAIGAYLLEKHKPIEGTFFVSLAVLYKIQPIFGLLLLLASFIRNKNLFFKASGVVIASAVVLFILPMLLLQNSLSSFLLFNSNSIQFYTFSIYAGILGVAYNTIGGSVSSLSQTLDYIWIASVLVAAIVSIYLVNTNKTLKKARSTDLLAIGILLWFALFKQMLPYYFLWALVPLLASNRLRSAALLIVGEFLGYFFFGLALLAVNVNTAYFNVPPGMRVSLFLLAGGICFSLFSLLAIREVFIEIKAEK